MVTQALHQVHNVGGDDDGAAACHIGLENILDIRGRDRVHRFEGLIEHQQGGGVDHGAGQGNFLGHTG